MSLGDFSELRPSLVRSSSATNQSRRISVSHAPSSQHAADAKRTYSFPRSISTMEFDERLAPTRSKILNRAHILNTRFRSDLYVRDQFDRTGGLFCKF